MLPERLQPGSQPQPEAGISRRDCRRSCADGTETAYQISTGTAAACGGAGKWLGTRAAKAAESAAKKAAEEAAGLADETAEAAAKTAAKEAGETAEEAVKQSTKDALEDAAGETAIENLDGIEGIGKSGSKAAGNIAKNLDTNNIPNMTKQEIIDAIPDNWKYTENNGFVHIKDEAGKIRIRIDPPDKVTQYPHVHVYDNDGNLLDSLGNIVDRKSPDGHIPYKN